MSALFSAASLEEIAAVVAGRVESEFGGRDAHLVWSLGPAEGTPFPWRSWPDTGSLAVERALIEASVRGASLVEASTSQPGWQKVAQSIGSPDPGHRVLLVAQWPDGACIPEQQPPAWHEFMALSAARLSSVVELIEQRLAVQRLEKTAKLQSALYAIADLASGDLDMPDMLRRIHAIVDELMYARNFFIALHNAAHDSVRFIYYADEKDPRPIDPDQEYPAGQIRNSLTLAMIRQGRSAMGPSQRLRDEFGLEQVDEAEYGPDSADWLGVPMVAEGQVRGAIVVQSYDLAGRFTEEDRTLLAFVAQHILTALLRKQEHNELELRVEERTRELTEEVRERKRGEKLQAALYSIADLASGELAMYEMLKRIHGVVDELMYAKNFYIALYNNDTDTLRFPYHADEKDSGLVKPEEEIPAEVLRNSLTLGLIRHGRTAMGPARDVAAVLSVPGGIGLGTPAEDFLGVPMVAEGVVRGVVVVQSYDPSVHYSEEDRALLAYVAQHILTALARKQAQTELESRVKDRTHELAAAVNELREQIVVRERAEQQLVHETLHDSLTGLPNRTYLYGALERALSRLQRDPEHRFAVLFLDLDRFKVINDSVGHLYGDEVLKQAAERLAECVRSSDVVARLGGDEFALLMEDIRVPEDACHTAQRAIEALSRPMHVAGKELFTSASVGIALGNARYRKPEELLRDADVAMYRAKAHGRHRFEIFDERLHLEALQLLDLESDLRRAIQREEFEPHFQSIVNLRDGSVVGYEALLRWRHPGRGLLLPGEFLKVAEDSGSVEQIDWQMFESTCHDIPALQVGGGYVTINVSPRHFRSPSLAGHLLGMLDSFGIAPECVRVEITEDALVENPDQVFDTLDRLRCGGVLAALDDFGTGYSSLSYLHRFPLHSLKIDRSFVSAMQPDARGGSTAVVRAVLALANTLGMEVIAEGIETEEQRQWLLEIGCELGQGFLFSRARPAVDWVRRRH
ncbi:bifunctional diguanylate cyclase/phosphodiesterase [Lysobacter fragariae]